MPTYPYFGIQTFCAAPHGTIEALGGGVAVLGVPWDQGVGYRPGARFGPSAIRAVSMRYPIAGGYFDPEREDAFLTDAEVLDLGDVDVVIGDVERTLDRVRLLVERIVHRGGCPLVLGGDHSTTLGVVRALSGRPLGVLQLDAHLDYGEEFGGVRITSSTVMRRVRELGHVQRLVQVGIRGLRTSPAAWEKSREDGNVLLPAHRFDVQAVLEVLDSALWWYVTVDLDVLDPPQAPGVSSPEPGGLTVAQVTGLLYALDERVRVVGCDVVELNPLVDPTGITAVAAANLAIRCASLLHAPGGTMG